MVENISIWNWSYKLFVCEPMNVDGFRLALVRVGPGSVKVVSANMTSPKPATSQIDLVDAFPERVYYTCLHTDQCNNKTG